MLLLLIILIYLLLFFFLPKGYLLQEIVHLPVYWFRMLNVDTKHLEEQKFTYGEHPRQYLLFYPPSGKKHKNQVIVYFHGGAWLFGSPERFRANAKFLVDLGYPVCLISHRRIPFYNGIDMKADCINALLKVLDIKKAQQLPQKKVILGGISAGANLAALLLYDKVGLKEAGIPSSLFSGIFLMGVPAHLGKMDYNLILRLFAGVRNSPLFAQANPYDNIDNAIDCPHLIVHGNRDGMVSYSSTVAFVEKLSQFIPKKIQFHTLENGTHLDAGKWMFQEDEVALVLKDWLQNIPD